MATAVAVGVGVGVGVLVGVAVLVGVELGVLVKVGVTVAVLTSVAGRVLSASATTSTISACRQPELSKAAKTSSNKAVEVVRLRPLGLIS